MYMVLPNQKNRFWDSLPGALLASSGWLVFSDLYSIYVEHFSNYSNIYGSVYAVALSMLWLYCCLSIVFYGGALNKLLMDAAKTVDHDWCSRAVKSCQVLDRRMKSEKNIDREAELKMLLMELAGRK